MLDLQTSHLRDLYKLDAKKILFLIITIFTHMYVYVYSPLLIFVNCTVIAPL